MFVSLAALIGQYEPAHRAARVHRPLIRPLAIGRLSHDHPKLASFDVHVPGSPGLPALTPFQPGWRDGLAFLDRAEKELCVNGTIWPNILVRLTSAGEDASRPQ